MSDPSLRIAELHVSYGAVPALRGVTIDVPPGGVTAVIGANGAGKSTLVRAVSGLVRVQSGSVTWGARSLTNAASHTITRAGIAHVPEGRRVVAPLTVEENLLLAGGAAKGRTTRSLQERVEAVYEVFPRLLERRSQSSLALSGGEQQMLAIGRALMTEPRFVLLDEPSMGLAPIAVKGIYELLSSTTSPLRSAGVLLAEQSAALAMDVADHVYLLAQGTIVLEGTPGELGESEDLVATYMGAR